MQVVSYHLALTLTFFILIFVSSYSIALKSIPSASASLRLIASCSIFAWILSIIFAILATFGLFQIWPAVIIASIGTIASRIFLWPTNGLLACIKEDCKSIHNSLRVAGGDLAWWTVFAVFFLLCALFIIRGLCLPLLGWDALTYHELKAGMWVQSGGWHTLEAPGGWEYYRTFFGGGEVFIAWAMLFCHSDLLSGAPDLFWWLLLGLSTFCLARQCGIQPRPAIFISLALICAPPFIKLVGTGYVDTGAYALLLCGFCLLARSIHSNEDGGLYIAAAALGVASSIKINLCAMIVLLMVPVFIILLIQGRRNIRLYLSCAALFLAPILPWLAYNVATYGYPLGSTAFSIGPLVFGKAPPNLVWFLDWPDLHAYESGYEWDAFWRSIQHYGAVLTLSVFGVPGVLYALWRRSAVHILGICLLLASITLYLHPSFSVIRLVWAGYNARFLVLIVILPAVIGLSVFTRFRRGQQFIEALS
ncbi:hypothetical protein K8I31_09705, partial [bacterium]|nr:hypothetical protein [bacterium]